ncbi:cob(I)yrinic acid a,c-diamide adenosyltransferase [Flavobacteriales bacterium]|nr:cob(I)yrinic acid a,c-diamide adenosyltransferase [Flavobacteriales bacterium]
MKIYTKQGDKGKTQLLGGTIVDKDHERIECYGSIDELNAYIGHIFDHKIPKQTKDILKIIQNKLFDMGSNIAFDKKNKNIILPVLSEKDIALLEEEIDNMEKNLPALTNFILPSGNKIASLTHIARTVCRRTERRLVQLIDLSKSENIHLKYLNRLSDFLFVLSRFIIIINDDKEIIWEKNL